MATVDPTTDKMMRMSRRTLIAVLTALVMSAGLLAGCSGAQVSAPEAPDPVAEVGPRVRISTDKGDLTVELRPDKAPKSVENFLKLADSGFYDGVLVHRAEPGFVVQAGDPLTRELEPKELVEILARRDAGTPREDDPPVGTGGPGWTVESEADNGLAHERGVIAMARSQDPDSAGSQFYLTLAPADFLDGEYTVFGKVIEGMDVVDSLAVGDRITSVSAIGK